MKKIKKLSLNEAKDRVTRLFCMESEYERIREKIIGTVFHYNPDIKKSYEQFNSKKLYI